jgi:hypothetical protein
MNAAHRSLDAAQTLAQLQALEATPGRFAELLATELVPVAASRADLEQRDITLALALAHIDTMIARAMRIRLDHALANDVSIETPTRKVFASTIISYAGRLQLLAQRAHDIAARGRAARPDEVADAVIEAATAVLTLRDALRDPVLALARDLAAVAVRDADRRAKDTQRDDVERRHWSAIRRDLESIVVNPLHLMTAPMPVRIAALPEQLDEPEPEPERSFADMIELD